MLCTRNSIIYLKKINSLEDRSDYKLFTAAFPNIHAHLQMEKRRQSEVKRLTTLFQRSKNHTENLQLLTIQFFEIKEATT